MSLDITEAWDSAGNIINTIFFESDDRKNQAWFNEFDELNKKIEREEDFIPIRKICRMVD